MEKNQILDYQKKFSKIHIILVLLVVIMFVDYMVYDNNYKVTLPFYVCFVIGFTEFMALRKNFFGRISFIKGLRYIEVLVISVLIVCDLYYYVNAILYVIYLALAIEFMITYETEDRYYQIVSYIMVIVPNLVLQIVRSVTIKTEEIILSGTICAIIVSLILFGFCYFYFNGINRLVEKNLAQLRYIEDANAMNQQLVENQEKVKKANEQLAFQTVKLESAYHKINNINMEILLQNEILKLISAHHDTEQLMMMIADTIRVQMCVTTFSIILFPNAVASQKLHCEIQTIYGKQYKEFLVQKIEEGELDSYIKQNELYIDNQVDPSKYSFVRNSEIGSLMIIPLTNYEEIIGGLYVADSKYDAFIDNVAFFTAAVSSIEIGIENGNLYARLEEMATKDELTKIYNRRYLNRFFDQFVFEALRDKSPLSVALFDIDKFKNINDSYGHLFGDEALKIVAKLASELAEEEDGVVGRYGGEEFVVLFPNRGLQSTYDMVKVYHDKIRNTKFYHEQNIVNIRLSVGISSFPETCLNPSDLLNYADWAMYYSKENGRDRITIDSSSVRVQVRLK